jgi:uncharacterized protein (DUF983 family)
MAIIRVPPRASVVRAMARGFRGACPNCGKGRIFWRYLKVNARCPACAHDLDRYPSDDGPAYFTIVLVSQLVIAPLLLFSFVWKAPLAVAIPATLIPLLVLMLALLPRIKGAVVGLLYALDVHRGDAALHTADRYD